MTYTRPPLKTCPHCKRQVLFLGPRGICPTCYRSKRIRCLFPTAPGYKPRKTHSCDGRKQAEWHANNRRVNHQMPVAEIPPGHLPCVACPELVPVSDMHRVTALRLCCPWAICRGCQERKGAK